MRLTSKKPFDIYGVSDFEQMMPSSGLPGSALRLDVAIKPLQRGLPLLAKSDKVVSREQRAFRAAGDAGRSRPDAERARGLAARMHTRLASSFSHVLDASLPHLAVDPAPVRAAIARIAAAAHVPPAIFILHRRCVRAAVQGELDVLRTGFERLSRSACAAPPGLHVRNFGDSSFGPAELADYRWVFAEDHGDLPITLAPATPASFRAACGALDRARAALRCADPAHAGEIEALISEVVFATGGAGSGMVFDGITAFFAHGALLLNAAAHTSVPEALAGLVHEAAHSWLFAETEGAPLVENDPAERYPSPLRTDTRPMNGIYHATIVSARMAGALDRVLANGCLARSDQGEAERLRATALHAFAAGQAALREHGRLIPLAHQILNDAEASIAAINSKNHDGAVRRQGPKA